MTTSLESRIIVFCTSTLAGVMAGNIFTIKNKDYPNFEQDLKQVKSVLKKRQLDLTVLREDKNSSLIYVYSRKKLVQNLGDKNSLKILKACGYSEFTTSAMIEKLKSRLKQNKDFPHEIGLFLGYPPQDVSGFIQNSGENYIYSGYWKVYADLNSRKQLFDEITKCRKILPKTLGLDQSLDFLAEFY